MILTNVMSMWKPKYKNLQSRVFMVQYDDLQVISWFDNYLLQQQFSVLSLKQSSNETMPIEIM